MRTLKLFYTFDLQIVRSSTLYEEAKKRDHKKWLSRRSKKGWENRATKKETNKNNNI